MKVKVLFGGEVYYSPLFFESFGSKVIFRDTQIPFGLTRKPCSARLPPDGRCRQRSADESLSVVAISIIIIVCAARTSRWLQVCGSFQSKGSGYGG